MGYKNSGNKEHEEKSGRYPGHNFFNSNKKRGENKKRTRLRTGQKRSTEKAEAAVVAASQGSSLSCLQRRGQMGGCSSPAATPATAIQRSRESERCSPPSWPSLQASRLHGRQAPVVSFRGPHLHCLYFDCTVFWCAAEFLRCCTLDSFKLSCCAGRQN